MNEEETETRLWIEYIEGVSGNELTTDMFEHAAYELGRWQGKLYSEQPDLLKTIRNLSGLECLHNWCSHCRYPKNTKAAYDYVCSEGCEIPLHLRRMIRDVYENTEVRRKRIEELPVILCHRDFWNTNIFCKDGQLVLIDWDCAGWGHPGEDVVQLIADGMDWAKVYQYYQ